MVDSVEIILYALEENNIQILPKELDENLCGYASSDGFIVLNTLLPKELVIETLVHEAVHIAQYKDLEDGILHQTEFIPAPFWNEGIIKLSNIKNGGAYRENHVADDQMEIGAFALESYPDQASYYILEQLLPMSFQKEDVMKSRNVSIFNEAFKALSKTLMKLGGSFASSSSTSLAEIEKFQNDLDELLN